MMSATFVLGVISTKAMHSGEILLLGFFAFFVASAQSLSVSRFFMAYALDYLAKYHQSAFERNDSDQLNFVSYIISMMGMRDPSRTQLSLATTCGYSTTLEGGVGCSAYFHYDSICQAVAIPPNTVSYNTFRSSEVMHHTGVCYSYDDERVYLNPVHLRISAWGGSSSSDASYSGRRDFAAANLWAGGLVPARLTLRAYVERMLNRGQVTNAQNTAGAWDSATAAEVRRQRRQRREVSRRRQER